MTEAAIQRAIGDYLEAAGYVWLDTSKPGGVVQRRRKLLGGYPDLEVVVEGRKVCLEVKAPGGRVGPKQARFADYLGKAGVPVYRVGSVADVKLALSGEGEEMRL